MFKKFLHLFGNKDYLKLSKNVYYLALTNGINFILPIVIIPFLIRRLGIERFGQVMIAQALMSFLVIITEYSFNNTGTQQASINRHDPQKLQDIFNAVFSTKMFLLAASFVVLCLLISIYPKFAQEKTLFILSFGMVIGKTLLPIWFFQGIEKMKYIAYANLLSKVLLALFIIGFIKNSSMYLYVNLLYSIGDIVAGILSILYLQSITGIKLQVRKFSIIKEQVKSGFYLFVSSLSINTSVNSNIIILGALTNSSVAGLYSIAEKVMLILKQVAGILLQASFPHACVVAASSEKKLQQFLKREFQLFAVVFFLAGVCLFLFSDSISFFFNKKAVVETSTYIRLFSIVPLIVSLNAPAYQSLIIHGAKRSLTSIIMIGAIISLSLNFLLVPYFGAFGTICSIIVTELFITLGLNGVLIYKHKNLRFI